MESAHRPLDLKIVSNKPRSSDLWNRVSQPVRDDCQAVRFQPWDTWPHFPRGASPSNGSPLADRCALRPEADHFHSTLGLGRQPGGGRHPPEALNAVVASHKLISPPGRVLGDINEKIKRPKTRLEPSRVVLYPFAQHSVRHGDPLEHHGGRYDAPPLASRHRLQILGT